jgi:hypothetical protein
MLAATIAGRIAHLPGVVHMHGIHSHIMKICRLLIGRSFHLKVFIVFEILCKCNIEGEKNISGYIGYKFLGYILYADQC